MTNTKNHINGIEGIDGIGSIIEDFGRARCGFLYEITLNNGKHIYLDLNHKIYSNDNKICFEKKKDIEGNEWDYAGWPIEDPVIHYFPNSPSDSFMKLINLIRKAYTEQEKKWKVNCKKPACNNCMACD